MIVSLHFFSLSKILTFIIDYNDENLPHIKKIEPTISTTTTPSAIPQITPSIKYSPVLSPMSYVKQQLATPFETPSTINTNRSDGSTPDIDLSLQMALSSSYVHLPSTHAQQIPSCSMNSLDNMLVSLALNDNQSALQMKNYTSNRNKKCENKCECKCERKCSDECKCECVDRCDILKQTFLHLSSEHDNEISTTMEMQDMNTRIPIFDHRSIFRTLYDRYIHEESCMTVNVSCDCRSDISCIFVALEMYEKQLASPKMVIVYRNAVTNGWNLRKYVTVFDKAVNEVFELLSVDPYMRFTSTQVLHSNIFFVF